MNKISKLTEISEIKIMYLQDKIDMLNRMDLDKYEKVERRIFQLDKEFNNTFSEIKDIWALAFSNKKLFKNLQSKIKIISDLEEDIKNLEREKFKFTK